MATPWILLHRTVNFIDGTGAATAIGGVPSPAEAMSAMKPTMAIAEPPEVTYLSMLRQTRADNMGGVHDGEISSTDEGLAVLYTGSYRPGNGSFSGSGCYLVYDASSSSVSAVPPLPPDDSPGLPAIDGLGRTAAVLRHRGGGGDGAYVLAELVTAHDRGLPDAELYLWWSSTSPCTAEAAAGQWTSTAVRLPLPPKLCGPTYLFEVDMAFAFAGSRVCWVDLFAGALVCDLLAPEGPEFTFVPLPEGCCVDIPIPYNRVGVPEQLRSMGCVRGAINFVCKDDATTLRTWALSPDLKEWEETAALRVEDLWASESFRGAMELPRITPTCPVLSAREDGVVYAALIDVEDVDEVDEFEDVDEVDEFGDVAGCFPEVKAHYVLRLDMARNKVLSFTKSSTDDLWLRPSLLASELSVYVQDSKDPTRTC